MARKKNSSKQYLRVAELFAGVGGFRLGLERASSNTYGFSVIFSNQWEPGKRKQHASEVYAARFGEEHHTNKDIGEIGIEDIPDHDVLVGGFPCQDYSVASTLHRSKGLVGKKGVLWWQIHRILSDKKTPPAYLILENVDRLLGSPTGQRGRDLAIMLRSLDLLGYAIEWRVINAADYGMPQRRRRVFLVGYHRSTPLFETLKHSDPAVWLRKKGVLAEAFPCKEESKVDTLDIDQSLLLLSNDFGAFKGLSPFKNAGVMIGAKVYTCKVSSLSNDEPMVLGDLLQPEKEVPANFYIARKDLKAWKYQKGAKSAARISAINGHEYTYSEGAMAFPDPLDKPARTIITGEGGNAASRFKHVVCQDGKRYRRLTPIELERINMFPDNHTEGPSAAWRAFFMGNALVVGVVERIGKALLKKINRS
ncbi:MAG: DNA (cytosine-5-)-methyltransferase [Flavobacteriales bacterium]|nr:DNA (cytosine-5-)-methyltransferase [Flavobacteriales bacterium]